MTNSFLFYSTILKHLQVPFSNDVVKNIEGAVKVSNFITILPYSNIDVFFFNVFQDSLYLDQNNVLFVFIRLIKNIYHINI